jgi:acetylornithine deacetylase
MIGFLRSCAATDGCLEGGAHAKQRTMASSLTLDYLTRLVAFPTVSRDSNLDLIDYVRNAFAKLGIDSKLVPSEDRRKANLFATVGPKDVPGVVLSGHTDVVPVEDQAWSSDPFVLRRADGKLYARGAVDMKGFIAACMALAHDAVKRKLATPIHFAFSYDEEVGCLGVRRLIAMLKPIPVKPRFCIVGEPTSMQVVTAHKGRTGAHVTCHGLEAHSSLAPLAVNAVYMAADLIGAIRAIQKDVAERGMRDGDYDVAYTTLHASKIRGGDVMNIVPNLCTFEYEIRHIAGDDPLAIKRRIADAAEKIGANARTIHPGARIDIVDTNEYPALDTRPDSEVVAFVRSLTGGNSLGKISFGTEASLFARDLGVPAVVCGPGSIAVAHKPDEYVSEDQLAQCEAMLGRLLDRLAA